MESWSRTMSSLFSLDSPGWWWRCVLSTAKKEPLDIYSNPWAQNKIWPPTGIAPLFCSRANAHFVNMLPLLSRAPLMLPFAPSLLPFAPSLLPLNWPYFLPRTDIVIPSPKLGVYIVYVGVHHMCPEFRIWDCRFQPGDGVKLLLREQKGVLGSTGAEGSIGRTGKGVYVPRERMVF